MTDVIKLDTAPQPAEVRIIRESGIDAIWISFPDGVEVEVTRQPFNHSHVVVRGWVDETHTNSMSIAANTSGVDK